MRERLRRRLGVMWPAAAFASGAAGGLVKNPRLAPAEWRLPCLNLTLTLTCTLNRQSHVHARSAYPVGSEPRDMCAADVMLPSARVRAAARDFFSASYTLFSKQRSSSAESTRVHTTTEALPNHGLDR